MIRTTVTLAIAATLLSACGGSDGTGSGDRGVPTEAPTPTTSAGPTPASVPEFQFGNELAADQLTAVVLEYRKGFDSIDSETRSDAVLVEMCNTTIAPGQGGEFIFSSLSWRLYDNDNGTVGDNYVTSGPGTPSPSFPEDNELAVGKCAKGWLLYSMPKSTTVASVSFHPDATDLALWPVL